MSDVPSADVPGTPSESTHFLFQHKVFTIPRAYFALAQDTHDPTYYVPLGDIQGVLSLPQLVSGFDIAPNSSDAKLLEVVEKGLSYVKRIQPGDSIPRELLDGTASWAVEDKDRMLAESRMRVQLVTWLAGKEVGPTDPAEIMKLANDPAIRDRVQEAAGELAQRLGLGAARATEVLFRIERLVREMSYLEALRARFASVKMIGLKLIQLGNAYGSERGFAQDIGRVVTLIKKPLAEYDGLFRKVDARTAKILDMVRDQDACIEAIRAARDDLHKRFMLWDDLIPQWQELPVEMGSAAETLVRTTYRLVVRHFPQEQGWERTFGGLDQRP
ncbi:MAG: hypothetical protein JO128_20650 [Alphaproteobacteria bacterium]|nr:hypothetical protein [Alphaproteobacteria bacterium]